MLEKVYKQKDNLGLPIQTLRAMICLVHNLENWQLTVGSVFRAGDAHVKMRLIIWEWPYDAVGTRV